MKNDKGITVNRQGFNQAPTFKRFKSGAGFTLIELLVVIAIIGLLSTLAVVSLNGARSKARDARRVSDLKAVSSALELYRDDNLDAVPDVTVGTTWNTIIGTNLNATAVYLPAGAPEDPDPTRASGQANVALSYTYCTDTDFYLLYASLENTPPGKGLDGDIESYEDGKCVNAGGVVNPGTIVCDGIMDFCLGRL